MNTTFRDIASDSIKYWEVRRIIYNVVLGLITLGYFFYGLPKSLNKLSFDSFLGFFVLAVIANVFYCAIYLPDFLAQISVFQPQWRRYRWIPFLIGLIFASIFTRWIVISSLGIDRGTH